MPVTINGTTGIAGVDGSASTPSYQGTDTNTGIFYPAADTIAFAEGGVESARFNSSGNLQLVNSLSVGNATPTTSGAGITFPATQNASSNANTLDDYEEGNWTPTVSGQTVAGTGTYTTQLGRYTKVGRLVTVEVYLNWTAHTGSGAMLFSNLPFTTNSFINSAGSVSYVNNIALTANNVFTIYTNTASTNISCSQYPVGGGAQSAVTLDTSADLVYSITYSVDN